MVDLYFKLYGRKRPHAVPIAELAMLNKATKIKSENSEAKVSLSMCELMTLNLHNPALGWALKKSVCL